MITICLDESGSFEGQGTDVRLIGGVVFKGDNDKGLRPTKEAWEEEGRKIEGFFKEQSIRLGLRYPSGIHARDISDHRKKYQMKEGIKEYLRESGGYHLALIIKGRSPKDAYRNKSNVVSDDVASNLYEHMICNIINNILFYNLNFLNEREAVLEIATRSIPVWKTEVEEIQKYEKLGYNKNDFGDYVVFYLTDQRTFKSAISTKMLEDEIEKNMNLEFNVQSINYHRTQRDRERDTTPWLYLADWVCDILRSNINVREVDFGMETLAQESEKITGNRALIWAYDNIDFLWKELFENLEGENYIECLKSLYNLEEIDSAFKKFYDQFWVSTLREKVEGLFDMEELTNYADEVRRLLAKDTVHSEENIKDNNMGLYIGEKLWGRLTDSSYEEIDLIQKYKLADLMLMGYNHKGNIEKAREYFDICMSMRDGIDPEDYCGTLLSVAQICANEFDFDGAIESIKIGEEYVKYLKASQKKLVSLYDKGSSLEYRLPLLGKIYSSLGQFYSFKRDKNLALRYFEMALDEMAKDPRNTDITLSFLIHLALDSRDRELYEKYISEYLEGDNLAEQLGNIMERHDRYKLFVFVKSLNTFYRDLDDGILDLLKECKWDEEEAFLTFLHPWELIYKHLSILFYSRGDRETGRIYKDRIRNVIRDRNSDLTLEIVTLAAEICVLYEYEKDMDSVFRRIESLKGVIKSNEKLEKYFGCCFKQKGLHEVVNSLKDKINYTYA